MEVCKGEISRKHDEVLWLAEEIRGQFDHLGAEYPYPETYHVHRSTKMAFEKSVSQCRVIEEGKIDK